MSGDDPARTMDSTASLQREANEWLALLTSGHATVTDLESMKRWCARSRLHAEAFAKANALWDALGQAGRETPRALPEAHVIAAGSARSAISRRAILLGGVAAAIAASGYAALSPPFGLWPSAAELAADVRTGVGERRQIALRSGASLDLNTRTSLNMPNDADRIDLVSGEVAVSTSQVLVTPLMVTAAGGRIRITEAQINLRCDEGRAVVTCDRGSVAVECSGTSVTLHQGQQIAYAGGALGPMTTVDPAVVLAWRTGELVFHQTPLSYAIEEVNRYRPARIVLMNEALGRRRVEARLPLDNLDGLITMVQDAFGARITRLPGGIVVLS